MHTVELLEEACRVAGTLGYCVRQEWLSGGGGPCEIKGKRWLFIDLSLPPLEQLDQVLAAVREVPDAPGAVPMSPQLHRYLNGRKAA